ncbi:hypothetical protein [Viridibacillus arvi]
MFKIPLILIMVFTCFSITWPVYAKDQSVDKFYSSLSENANVYKEYKNATLNIREKVNGSELEEVVQKKLGKYALHNVTDFDYSNQELYFFASVFEDKYMIVKKYAFYDLKGNLLESGFDRTAKKEAVLNGEFKGWNMEDVHGEDTLSDDDPIK